MPAPIIFPGSNDLVVDTVSMTEFASNTVFPAGNLRDFSTNAEVHHCNYFESDETLDFISTHWGSDGPVAGFTMGQAVSSRQRPRFDRRLT